jgi:hypothetical protein
LIWRGRGSNLRTTTLEANTLTITPPIRFQCRQYYEFIPVLLFVVYQFVVNFVDSINKNVDIKFSAQDALIEWITLIRYAQCQNIWFTNNLSLWEQKKPKGLNRIATIGYCHLYDWGKRTLVLIIITWFKNCIFR